MFPKLDFKSKLAILVAVIFYSFAGQADFLMERGLLQPLVVVAEVPEDVTRYTVRINELNGKVLGDPIYIDSLDSYSLLPEGSRMGELKSLLAQMGSAYFNGDTNAEALHEQFLAYLSEFESADYDIVLHNFTSTRKYASNFEPVDDIIASFSYGN